MKKISVDISNLQMDANLYTGLVNLLNSLIEYLNRNYTMEENKKGLITETNLPNEVELLTMNKKIEDFYNKDVIRYWNRYVVNK